MNKASKDKEVERLIVNLLTAHATKVRSGPGGER